MKKIKTILSFAVIGSFATLPIILSSCNEKEQLELNGQKLYKNAQLAANYNELKKSNSKTISNINLLFPKVDSKFNKKISINASAFIDWANVEKILKYNEKYSDKEWYKMLVRNLYDAVINNRNIKDSLVLDPEYKDWAFDLHAHISHKIILNENNLVNSYILNNYIKYILGIIEGKKGGKNTNSINWLNNIKDILKKLVVPSAYIIDPIVVENNSNFLSLKNSNLWDILKNKNQFISTIMSPFDLTDSEYQEINKKHYEINKKNKDSLPEDNSVSWYNIEADLMSKINPVDTIWSWKKIIEKINSNKDYTIISLQKEKIIDDNNNYFLNIKFNIPNSWVKNYKIENTNKNKNETSIKIILDDNLPLSFRSFKKNYGKLIRNAIAYTLWMNITALKPFNPKNKDINEIDFKYDLLLKDKFSCMFFDELLNQLWQFEKNQTSLEMIVPLDSVSYKENEKILTRIEVFANQLSIFEGYNELEMEHK
ncbi:hypothetical protein ACNQ2A_00825 [Mycoplasma sp. 1458C]|uniref:hypothetical protein n=3 Tax=Mycoplasma TaxID=2093 RepID=UPI003AAF26E9